jgi:predicted nucleic acid-binding protein
MTAVVVDASVAVKWFVLEPGADLALDLLRSATERLAPEFLMVEVATALSRRERLGEIPSGQASSDLKNLPLYFYEFVPSASLLDAAMALSLNLRHPLPDCIYLALSQQRGAPLVTADAAFVAKLANTPYAANSVLLTDWKP